MRASAVFALGTLLNVGSEHTDDDDEKIKIELTIIKSLLDLASDGSPLVRAEVAVGVYTCQNIHFQICIRVRKMTFFVHVCW